MLEDGINLMPKLDRAQKLKLRSRIRRQMTWLTDLRNPTVEFIFHGLEERLSDLFSSYPYGFSDSLITFTNKDGGIVSALPFETDDRYYMVRMTVHEALQIIEDDDDFDADGTLKDGIKEEYESKYAEDIDDVADEISDDESIFD